MGIINLSDAFLSERTSNGRMRPIGVIPRDQVVELTQVKASSKVEEIVYGRQIQATLTQRIKRSLYADEPDFTIEVMEIKTPQTNSTIHNRDILVCAEFPYSSFSMWHTNFKKGTTNLPKLNSRAEFLTRLKKTSVNWWDTGDKYYTATLLLHEFAPSLLDRAKYARQNSGFWLFAVVQHKLANKRLELSDVIGPIYRSATFQELIKQASEGKLAVGKGFHTNSGDSIDSANSAALMAIQLALAGPRKDFDKYEGTPVIDEAQRIYRDILSILSKRKGAEKTGLLERQEPVCEGFEEQDYTGSCERFEYPDFGDDIDW